jgi:hypothetical protein
LTRPDEGHGDQKSGDQNDQPTTAQRLGEAYGVGEATIRRDAEFAEAVDTLEEQPASGHPLLLCALKPTVLWQPT